MKSVLVLGAGLVSKPLVRYLLDDAQLKVTVTDQVLEKARCAVGGHENGQALALNAADEQILGAQVKRHDVVVSLLPWSMHTMVARQCLQHGTHLVTASYVKPDMQALHADAVKKGLVFLNEVGLDPGIDHMAAMQVIDEIKRHGGKVESFYSYCGGLPSLSSNNNPLGYKFSWSPEGALLAANNDGRYLVDGQVIDIPGNQLFEHYWLLDVPGAGVFEAYVNRDALPYLKLYGIESARSIYRGTLRNVGYCETWDYFKKMGLMNRQMKFDFNEVSPKEVMANLIHSQGQDMVKEISDHLHIPPYSLTIKKLAWLGLFSEEKLPLGTVSVFDMFAHALKQKLVYHENETDLILQHHEFVGVYQDGRSEKTETTLIDTGTPGGDTSMARTVGLPAAIATQLIAQGQISEKGVCIPVKPEFYRPILKKLESLGIAFKEQRTLATAN